MPVAFAYSASNKAEVLEQKRQELEQCLENLFPDRHLKVVRTITREQLVYLVDSANGQITTLVLDGEGSFRVRYPTGYTSDKLDPLVDSLKFHPVS